MQKIDRLGWVAGLSFTSYGLCIGVRVNKPELLRAVRQHLPPGWKPTRSLIVDRLYSLFIGSDPARSSVRRFNLLYADVERAGRTMGDEEILEIFESDVRRYVAAEARGRTFIHAGVVGWRGNAIMIPGKSMSGKTTLVAELVRAGATYYSDEYAVLDEHGLVHPYPKPLSIRENGTYKQTHYSIREFGGKIGSKPLPVGLVVLSSYKEKSKWRPRQLSVGRRLMALLAHAVSLQKQPEVVLTTLQQVVSKATVLKGVRGEAQETVARILERIDKL